MPDVDGRGRGDLFATVQVQTPKKLTKEQRSCSSSSPRRCRRKSSSRARGDEEQDERNLFDRVKDMFG